MVRSPFIEDPRDLLVEHVALAVDSPIEEVRAFHIGAAEHQAAIARCSGLVRGRSPDDGRSQRWTRVVIRFAFLALLIAVLGMAALGLSLVRS